MARPDIRKVIRGAVDVVKDRSAQDIQKVKQAATAALSKGKEVAPVVVDRTISTVASLPQATIKAGRSTAQTVERTKEFFTPELEQLKKLKKKRQATKAARAKRRKGDLSVDVGDDNYTVTGLRSAHRKSGKGNDKNPLNRTDVRVGLSLTGGVGVAGGAYMLGKNQNKPQPQNNPYTPYNPYGPDYNPYSNSQYEYFQ